MWSSNSSYNLSSETLPVTTIYVSNIKPTQNNHVGLVIVSETNWVHLIPVHVFQKPWGISSQAVAIQLHSKKCHWGMVFRMLSITSRFLIAVVESSDAPRGRHSMYSTKVSSSMSWNHSMIYLERRQLGRRAKRNTTTTSEWSCSICHGKANETSHDDRQDPFHK